MQHRTLKLLALVGVVGGAVAFLLYTSVAGAGTYYKHVEDLMPAPEEWVGKSLQVHGYVKPQSIQEEIIGQSTNRTFVLQDPSKRYQILVKHQGPRPDTFKDRAEVVAKGRLVLENGEYILYADELMAKCPSKYEEGRRERTLGGGPSS